jgi:hypothetical protein
MVWKWDRPPETGGLNPWKVAGRIWQGTTIRLPAPRDALTNHHLCTHICTPWGCIACPHPVHKPKFRRRDPTMA